MRGRRRRLPAVAAALAGAVLARPAAAELCPKPAELGVQVETRRPAPLTGRFMGVSTLLLDDGEQQILVDGFFSRPKLRQALFGRLSPEPKRIDEGLRAAGAADRLAAVLVAHSHHDHALDAPQAAKRSGALLIGSPSVHWIARGQALSEHCLRQAADGPFTFGAFEVKAFASRHSRPELYPGPIRAEVRPGARAWRYRGGENYAYLIRHGDLNLLVHPSAGADPATYRDERADIVFLGVAGLGWWSERRIEDYWRAVVTQTGAKVVVPIHGDDFAAPLEGGLRPMPFPLDRARRRDRVLARLARRCGVEWRPFDLAAPVPLERLASAPAPAANCLAER